MLIPDDSKSSFPAFSVSKDQGLEETFLTLFHAVAVCSFQLVTITHHKNYS